VKADEDDVLSRYKIIALGYQADIVVRITGDCPLIDAEIVDKTISALGGNDFASNVVERTYPQGLDVEVMPVDTLMRLDRYVQGEEREHVCSTVYHDDRFTIASVTDDEDNGTLRWCVDYEEDLVEVGEMLTWGILPYKELLRGYVEQIAWPRDAAGGD